MNDDRLASLRNQVSRDPLVRGGTCLVSHRLNSSRPERWEFRLSASYRWTTGILIGLGGVICGFAIAAGERMGRRTALPDRTGGPFPVVRPDLMFHKPPPARVRLRKRILLARPAQSENGRNETFARRSSAQGDCRAANCRRAVPGKQGKLLLQLRTQSGETRRNPAQRDRSRRSRGNPGGRRNSCRTAAGSALGSGRQGL